MISCWYSSGGEHVKKNNKTGEVQNLLTASGEEKRSCYFEKYEKLTTASTCQPLSQNMYRKRSFLLFNYFPVIVIKSYYFSKKSSTVLHVS